MKPISVKLPSLKELSKLFTDVVIKSDNGTYVVFGINSIIDFEDLDKTVVLHFSTDWDWVVGKDSFTGIEVGDLRIIFPNREFKLVHCFVRIGLATSFTLTKELDIITNFSYKLNEKEIAGIEELLATRRELKCLQ